MFLALIAEQEDSSSRWEILHTYEPHANEQQLHDGLLLVLSGEA